MSDSYDINSLIKMRKVPLWQRILLMIMVPFYIPKALFDLLKRKIDRNPLHDGVRNLSGKKIAYTGKDIMFE